jgi:hypothetical protein
MSVSKSVVRGEGRNRGAVSAGGDEILPPPFSLACGSSYHAAISMVAAARAGVDHFWLLGAIDEDGSMETPDSSVSLVKPNGALTRIPATR